MLHVDGEAVEALRRHDLGGEGTADGAPAVDRGPALGPELLQAVRYHAHTIWLDLTSR